jgi:hypothetical protein
MPENSGLTSARNGGFGPFANGSGTVQSYCAMGTGVVMTVDVAPLIAAFNT